MAIAVRHRRARWWRNGWRLIVLVTMLLPLFSAHQNAHAQQPPETPFLRIEPGMHTDQVRRVVALADGQILATASNDKSIRLWRADGALLRTLRPPIANGHEGSLRALAISSERRLVAAGGSTGSSWAHQALVYLFPLDQDRMQRLQTGVRAEISALSPAPAPATDRNEEGLTDTLGSR